MAEVIGRNTVSGELLRSFVERIENIADEKERLADDRKVVLAEAKSQGFVPSAINAVVKLRRMKPSERQESEAILDCYLHALGEAIDTPLFRAVGLMKVDITVRDQVIDALKKLVPSGGSITVEAGGAPMRLTRGQDGNVSVSEVAEKPAPTASYQSDSGDSFKRAKPDVPDVTPDEAEEMGKIAFRDDQRIIDNPFPFGDVRRPRWDKGWRSESGSDGMGD